MMTMKKPSQQSGGELGRSLDSTVTPSAVGKQPSALLNLSSICAGYRDRPVLHDVSLAIAKNERAALIGPNGCGKTTLLKVISGALRPTDGRVAFRDADIVHIPGHQRIGMGMGYLMQTRNIFPSLSVEENLHLSFWHGDGAFVARRDWVLGIFPMLRNRLQRRAGFLSGGERQALAIGMVLIRPVELLLLDEPTAGLSPKAAVEILEALHRAQTEERFSCIMVEHNLRLIQPWVTRVLVMQQGRVVTDCNDSGILFDPEHLQRFYFA